MVRDYSILTGGSIWTLDSAAAPRVRATLHEHLNFQRTAQWRQRSLTKVWRDGRCNHSCGTASSIVDTVMSIPPSSSLAGDSRPATVSTWFVGEQPVASAWSAVPNIVYTLSVSARASKNGIRFSSSQSDMSSNHEITGTFAHSHSSSRYQLSSRKLKQRLQRRHVKRANALHQLVG